MYAVINPLILLAQPLDHGLYGCTLPHHTKGNDMTNDTSPAENEYLAAIANLHEQTPSPAPRTYAIGDFVSGMTAGKRWSGRVEIIEGNRMTLDVGGGWVAVPVSDITH